MSTINAANITDGTDTVATGYVVNGSAKVFNHLNSDLSVANSLNISSCTDDGGTSPNTWTMNMTSAMSGTNYVVVSTADDNAPRVLSIIYTSSSAYRSHVYVTNSPSSGTGNVAHSAVFGDLA